MASVTTDRAKVKGPARVRPTKQRWVNWVTPPRGPSRFGVLRIREQIGNGKVTEYLYFARQIPSDLGVGIEFSELDGSGDQYQTSVDPEADPDAGADHCCCPGFERYGRPCKHISSTRALIASGRLGW